LGLKTRSNTNEKDNSMNTTFKKNMLAMVLASGLAVGQASAFWPFSSSQVPVTVSRTQKVKAAIANAASSVATKAKSAAQAVYSRVVNSSRTTKAVVGAGSLAALIGAYYYKYYGQSTVKADNAQAQASAGKDDQKAQTAVTRSVLGRCVDAVTSSAKWAGNKAVGVASGVYNTVKGFVSTTPATAQAPQVPANDSQSSQQVAKDAQPARSDLSAQAQAVRGGACATGNCSSFAAASAAPAPVVAPVVSAPVVVGKPRDNMPPEMRALPSHEAQVAYSHARWIKPAKRR